MNVHVVIGANFGDEGKGLTTDYLCRINPNSIVVRFNGGSQAGHTVQTFDGMKHVFKHFGSGTLANVPTYLSEYFIVNPVEFIKEFNTLKNKVDNHYGPSICIHPEAMVTTPYDMMVNWAIENKRREESGEPHGSCGMGINETVTRHEWVPFFYSDVTRSENIPKLMAHVREYYKGRIEELGLEDYIDKDFYDEKILLDYQSHCEIVTKHAHMVNNSILSQYDDVIFEGAQGLLLDEDHQWYPHVTRSKTGLHNVQEILNTLTQTPRTIEVYYITRAYLTRHGNGPLPHECPVTDLSETIHDETNFTNHFQGHLRFAPVNYDLLETSITNDLLQVDLRASVTLVVTCINQLPDFNKIVLQDVVHELPKQLMLDMLDSSPTWSKMIVSDAPSAESFKYHETMKKVAEVA